ncbi:hypothetical protein [Nonomuraea sp. NPDC050783]|uniref:hypothetical protein n=1 Tax=Nonomuraea sp. NPDC050783 TaxID=3154634 RepID=UPI0034651A05
MRLVDAAPARRLGSPRHPAPSWIQTRIEDVTPEELERRLGDPGFTAATAYVQRPGTEIFPRS